MHRSYFVIKPACGLLHGLSASLESHAKLVWGTCRFAFGNQEGARPAFHPLNSSKINQIQGLSSPGGSGPALFQLNGSCLCSLTSCSNQGPSSVVVHCPAVHQLCSSSRPRLQHTQQPSSGSQLGSESISFEQAPSPPRALLQRPGPQQPGGGSSAEPHRGADRRQPWHGHAVYPRQRSTGVDAG